MATEIAAVPNSSNALAQHKVLNGSMVVGCLQGMPTFGVSLFKTSVDICVRNPITHSTWDNGKYISYEIAINTSNQAFSLLDSVVRRRYSEFDWLRKQLKLHHPLLKPPSLPPKKFFGDQFGADFIAFRMKGLEHFLNTLISEKFYMSDTLLHLFMQTNLTCGEIDQIMKGQVSADIIDSLWRNKGVKENSSVYAKEVLGKISNKSSNSSNDQDNSHLDFNSDASSDCSSSAQEED